MSVSRSRRTVTERAVGCALGTEAVPPAVVVAAATPFNADGGLDVGGIRYLLQHLCEIGAHAVFVGGTTGEFATMSLRERHRLMEVAVDSVEADRLILHVGAEQADDALDLAQAAKGLGADAIAAITPFGMTSTADLHRFYAELAEVAGGLSVTVYLFEQVSGTPVSPHLLDQLTSLEMVVGAKVSGMRIARVVEFLTAVSRPDVQIWTGASEDMSAALERGATGVVSGPASLAPRVFLDVADAWREGNHRGREAAQADIEALVKITGGSPGLIKHGLRHLGLPAGPCRAEIVPEDDTRVADLQKYLDSHQISTSRNVDGHPKSDGWATS